ncbi:MAG: transcription termination factor Rho [Clostridia bacterium]|nr:transcription termination factor Rho [Clostridia bacterium]
MTREMLLEKSLEDLRAIARAQGLKAITKYRKAELVDLIMGQGEGSENGTEQSETEKKNKNAAQRSSAQNRKASVIMPAENDGYEAPALPGEALQDRADVREQASIDKELAAEVDYSPRRRGRPRKAINDPTPANDGDTADEPNADAPVPENQELAVPLMPRQERYEGDRRAQQYKGYQRNDAPNSNFGRQNQDYRQNSRYDRGFNNQQQSGFNSRQNQVQNRYNQNRYYNDRNDYQNNRNDFQRGYQPQGYQSDMRQYPPMDYQQDYQPPMYGYGQDGEQMGYPQRQGYYNAEYGTSNPAVPEMLEAGDCGDAEGILEVVSEGYGFLRCENYLPGSKDVYISNAQIRRFRLKTGDKVTGKTRPSRETDKFPALLYITEVNGCQPESIINRKPFEELIPIFPNERLTLESKDAKAGERLAIRLIDLMSPIGKGQRGLIVSQPKAGKTTLLKNIANGISKNYPDITLIVLLIDERPEEVTDMQRSIEGEVVFSTFDELPERHTRVAEMVMERSMRLVEQGKDVVVLMDSITRLARAYNLTITPTGRTLSGGMDPGALYKPKRFFGAARNIENGGSLTVIATALVETGSRMDDMVYEEFKGTGNMEIHLDRKLSEKRIFPAVDIYKSGTRRDELLLSKEEAECATTIRRMLSMGNAADVTEQVIEMLGKTETNEELLAEVKRMTTAYEGKGYVAGKSFAKHY